MSAWKGFGQHDNPEVYSPEGVISLPSGLMGLRMSIVAHSDAIAIHTLFIPRKRPGQMLWCAQPGTTGQEQCRRGQHLPTPEAEGGVREHFGTAVGAWEEPLGLERLRVVVHTRVHRHAPGYRRGA